MRDPWAILGIDPTPDPAAIRRAYATQLKTRRPDEDAERFQLLVEARDRALAWHWPGPDEAPEPEGMPEGIVMHFDQAQLDALIADDHGAVPLPEDFRFVFEPNFQPAPIPTSDTPGPLASLAALLSGPTWDGPAWQALMQEAAGLDIGTHGRLRDAVLQSAIPRLPVVPAYDDMRDEYFAGTGPGAVVDALEAGFGFGGDQAGLARQAGSTAALRYLGWLDHARRTVPPARRTPGQQRALALIDILTDSDPAQPARAAWHPADADQLVTLLDQMPPDESEPCLAALLHALGRQLPADCNETIADYASGRSIAKVVETLHFDLELGAGPRAASLPPAYTVWLEASERLHFAQERQRTTYRDENGIPLLPPEDAAIGIWSQPRFIAYWLAARRRGRWPLAFDLRAMLFPVSELCALGLASNVATGLNVAVWLVTMAASMQVGLGWRQHWLSAAWMALFLGGRVALALLLPRWAVLMASRRIARADRSGVQSLRHRTARLRMPVTGPQYVRRACELAILFMALTNASPGFTAMTRHDEALERARNFAAQGHHAAAVNAYDSALQIDPTDAQAELGRALSHVALRDGTKALAGFSRVLKLEPGNVLASAARASILVSLGRNREALYEYDRALTQHPGDPAILSDRALLFETMGDRRQAIEDFTAVLAHAPYSGLALVGRGRQYAALGDTEAALRDFASVLGNAGAPAADKAAAYMARGHLFVGMGVYDSAVSDFTRAATDGRWQGQALRAAGFAQFYAGAFAASAEALALSLREQPQPYALLFWHVAGLRAGTADAAAFRTQAIWPRPGASPIEQRPWPFTIMQLFLGDITPDALAAAAATEGQRCEAAFYTGEWHVVQARPAAALVSFTAAAASCPHSFVEYPAAITELARLQTR